MKLVRLNKMRIDETYKIPYRKMFVW
jgi:hypothetical protein